MFSKPHSMISDRDRAEAQYAALSCHAGTNTTVFISTEGIAYDTLRVAGAVYSDYSRIKLVLAKLTPAQRSEYDDYKKGSCA